MKLLIYGAFLIYCLSTACKQKHFKILPPKPQATNTKPKKIPSKETLKRSIAPVPTKICEDSVYGRFLQKQFTEQLISNNRNASKNKRLSRRSIRRKSKFLANTRLTPFTETHNEIPVIDNQHVRQWIGFYTTRGRFQYTKWLQRLATLREVITPILREEGVPSDLIFLAMIESGFNNRAYSRARATGTWQFMKRTGHVYGLRVNYWLDERRDLEKSTKAAARYLRDLYRRFGKWELAMAAYNAGPSRVAYAVRRTKLTDFWSLRNRPYLRRETKNYLPKIFAALAIAKRPRYHGFHVSRSEFIRPVSTTVKLSRPVRMAEVAEKLSISLKKLKKWNPELARSITPPLANNRNLPYELKLHPSLRKKFLSIQKNLSDLQIKSIKIHKVRKGDTLISLAKKYRISLGKILAVNPNLHPRRLRIGKPVYIPVPSVSIKPRKSVT